MPLLFAYGGNMRNIKLTIEYDGKEFNGWQKQPNKLNIQGTIEQAIKSITGEEEIELNASGRTDAGVHAIGQVANFKTNSQIPIDKFAIAINTRLETHIPQKLDIDKMKEAVKYFEGEHDFKAFKASGTSSKSSVRTIYKAEVKQEKENRIYIELTGNGFLYNMVRIIVGTLVEVGIGKIEPNQIPEIIKSKKRENAGKTLPPNGLYLVNVMYE